MIPIGRSTPSLRSLPPPDLITCGLITLILIISAQCETSNVTVTRAGPTSTYSSDGGISFSAGVLTAATTTPAAAAPPLLLVKKSSTFSDHPNFSLLPSRNVCGLVAKLRKVHLYTSRGSSSRGKRVAGGRIAHPGYLPGLAIIKLRNPQATNNVLYTSGGGALINSKYVLTNAYTILRSVRGSGNVLEAIGFKSNLVADNWNSVPVQSVLIHPNYNPATRANDIALIRLTGYANHSSPLSPPICLPLFENEEEEEEDRQRQGLSDTACSKGNLITAGWGDAREDTSTKRVTIYPNYVEMKLRPAHHCNRVYSRAYGVLNEGQICASSCLGERSGLWGTADSGAVLMRSTELESLKQYTLYGLASYYEKCGHQGLPSVYTNVSYFIPWILASIRP